MTAAIKLFTSSFLSHELSIGIYGERSVLRLNEYIDLVRSGKIHPKTSDLSHGALIFIHEGNHYDLCSGTFVEMFGKQFRFVHDNLEKGQPAYLKYDICYGPESNHLLFEAQGEEVLVSHLLIADHVAYPAGVEVLRKFSETYPFLFWLEAGAKERYALNEELVAWILENRQALKSRIPSEYRFFLENEIRDLRFPKAELLEQLRLGASLATEVYAVTGLEVEYDIY